MEPTPVPNALTTDKYFINRHHWLLWIPSLIGLFIGMYVGGSIADKDKATDKAESTIHRSAVPTSTSSTIATSSASADWITYTNMIDQYYFLLPRGWSITEELSSFGPSVTIGNDDPHDGQVISITKSPNPTHLSVEQFVRKYYPGQTPIFKPTTVGGTLPALQTTFSGDTRNCDSGVDIFLPHNDSMFAFSYHTCITTTDLSPSDDTIFRRLLSTVRFSDTKPQ